MMKFLRAARNKFAASHLQNAVSIGDAAARLRKHRLEINSVISLGAGSGGDTALMHNALCPESKLLMVEAQDTHKPALEKLRMENPKRDHVICAAAASDGEVSFLASAPTGGAVAQASPASITVPARSIDSLVAERKLTGPYFLKFDTHGVEIDILNGAVETLRDTQLIMMECYNFKLHFVGNNNLTFYEMCSYMMNRGFRCVDMSDPLFRPGDLAFWQIQLYFIRSDHPTFNSSSYSAPSPFRD